MVKIPTESRASEAMELFIRDLGDRALSAVLSDPKDKCRYSLGCGKVLWAFVKRGNSDRMRGGTFHFLPLSTLCFKTKPTPKADHGGCLLR